MTRPCSKGPWAQVSRACCLREQDQLHAKRSRCPRPLPVPSLGSLAALPGAFIAPAPALSRADPRPFGVGSTLLFSIIVLTFCPAK